MKTLKECILESAAYYPMRHRHQFQHPEDADKAARMSVGSKHYSSLLGGGADAKAFQTPTGEGHEISLRSDGSFPDPSKNAKLTYLSYAAKHAHENPHLPRVSEVRQFAYNENGRKYAHTEHTMERLHHVHSLEPEELRQMWKHSFGREFTTGGDTPDVYEFTKNLMHHLGTHYSGREYDKYKPNEHLGKVLQTVKDIHNRNAGRGKIVGIDIHANNFMARKTPYGHQLVITDPLIG